MAEDDLPIEEPDDAGDEDLFPDPELVELFEVLEWEKASAEEGNS